MKESRKSQGISRVKHLKLSDNNLNNTRVFYGLPKLEQQYKR